MTDTGRVLAAAAVLSLSAFAVFAWRVRRTDSSEPERLIGELRLSQWAAVLLATTGAASIGFAGARASIAGGTIDATTAALYVLLAGAVLYREPKAGLLLAAMGFLGHALFDLAHRPGWLPDDLMPRWYAVGCAASNLAMAATCFWAQRRQ